MRKWFYPIFIFYFHRFLFFISPPCVTIGRALLELQSLLPHSITFCINKVGYTYTQASTRNELALVAEHYNISILCATTTHHGSNKNKNVGAERSRNQPILPHIRLTSGVQNEGFTYPHASMKLILSQHAINEGSD